MSKKDRPTIPSDLYDIFWTDPTVFAKKTCKKCKGKGSVWVVCGQSGSWEEMDLVLCHCTDKKLKQLIAPV